MPLKTQCPSCGHALTVPLSFAGTMLRCPVCRERVQLPAAEKPKTPPPLRKNRSKPPPLPSARETTPPVAPPPSPATAPPSPATAASSPVAPAPSPAATEAALRGMEHAPAKRQAVYWLAALLAFAALLGAIPASWDVVDHVRRPDSPGVAPWACLLLLAAGLQLAYAVYVAQLPDWSTLWVVSVFSLVVAAGFAALVGLALLARADSPLMAWLGLADAQHGRRAAWWGLGLVSLSGLVAYLAGRVSTRWRRSSRFAVRPSDTG